MSVLDTYDTMSRMALMALKSVPFGLVSRLPRVAVSKRRLVLVSRRDSAARADLRASECTNPIDSVHAVTARFIDKLRISVLTELVEWRVAMNPVYTVGSGWNGVLRRQDGGRATSSMVPL